MAANMKLFFAALLLSLIARGSMEQCDSDSLTVYQGRTGREVKHKTEWKVTILNECVCERQDVKLSCPGFRSVEPVNLTVLNRTVVDTTGDVCIINHNVSIAQYESVSFAYAWDHFIQLGLLSYRDHCT